MDDSFGELVKDGRTLLRMSQRDVAYAIGIDFTYLSKIENDRLERPPSEKVVLKLVNALGLDEEQCLRLTHWDWPAEAVRLREALKAIHANAVAFNETQTEASQGYHDQMQMFADAARTALERPVQAKRGE